MIKEKWRLKGGELIYVLLVQSISGKFQLERAGPPCDTNFWTVEQDPVGNYGLVFRVLTFNNRLEYGFLEKQKQRQVGNYGRAAADSISNLLLCRRLLTPTAK